MTEDEQRAELILRRWIHKATGTSDLEREMQKLSAAFHGIRKAAQTVIETIFTNFAEKEDS